MESLEKEFDKIKDYDFDFENIVFEGCGMKIVGYVGAIRALEALGVMQKCKRFAGASSGAIVAMQCAVGENSAQIEEFYMGIQPDQTATDTRFGWLSLIPNLYRKFGWNSGEKFKQSLRNRMLKMTGNADITFKEVYERYGNELCVVAANLSTMSVTYFHPKTTPHMSVALAVFASCSLPFFQEPVVATDGNGGKPMMYVDGGILSIFPLHIFDGWYLSMKPEDSFFRKLVDDKEQFVPFNVKTLGLVQYATGEGEYLQGELNSRVTHCPVKRPKTELAQERAAKYDELLCVNIRRHDTMMAAKRFLVLLNKMAADQNNGAISLDDFRAIFESAELSASDKDLLFGTDSDFKQAFTDIDKDSNGQITWDEFYGFLQSKDIDLLALIEGGHMREIETFGDFYDVTIGAMFNVSRRNYLKKDDKYRMAGIYTDYLVGFDFKLVNADKRFLINQGINGTLMYFQYLVNCYKEGTLPDSMSGCISEKKPNTYKENDVNFTTNSEPKSNEVHDCIGDRGEIRNGSTLTNGDVGKYRDNVPTLLKYESLDVEETSPGKWFERNRLIAALCAIFAVSIYLII